MGPAILAGSEKDLKFSARSSEESINAFTRRLLLPPDPDEGDASGAKAIEWASFAGHTKMVAKLLGQGCSAEVRDNGGLTPLLGATLCSDAHSMTELLLVAGDLSEDAVNKGTANLGITPLDRAAKNGQLSVVGLLLERRADLDALRNNGMTPVVSATAAGQVEICKVLLVAGAHVNATRQDGQSVLHMAAQRFSEYRGTILERLATFGKLHQTLVDKLSRGKSKK